MRVDKYGELVSEIWPEGNIANLGNAMAETFRYRNLFASIRINPPPTPLSYNLFRTDTSYLQAIDPDCPKDWLVSSDQCLPFYIAYKKYSLGEEMKQRIIDWGLKTPDGNFISIPFFCLLFTEWLLPFVVVLQALSLRLPFSWGEKIADHLNWYQTTLVCPKWVLWFMPKDILLDAVEKYYMIEPNNQGLLDLYAMSIHQAYQT